MKARQAVRMARVERFMPRPPLAGVAACTHARRIRIPVPLVMALVLVEPVERAATRTDHAADGCTLTRTFPSACYGASRGTEDSAGHGPDPGILHRVHGLVALSRLSSSLLVARLDGGVRRHGRRRRRSGWGCCA